jgi:hypothetical protein
MKDMPLGGGFFGVLYQKCFGRAASECFSVAP